MNTKERGRIVAVVVIVAKISINVPGLVLIVSVIIFTKKGVSG